MKLETLVYCEVLDKDIYVDLELSESVIKGHYRTPDNDSDHSLQLVTTCGEFTVKDSLEIYEFFKNR